KENERDLLDVPAEVKEGMDLIFVEHVNEVLPLALAADREEIFPGASAEPLWRTLRADFAPIAKGGESSASPACPA
ncbi:MAG: S16 family serine protease, partial [Desulfovibrionaceae bacterium]|nr:S16 family serine protease [Desulfovibrionaceae bacterium]